MKKVVIAVGGTGGHVIPAMALGDELEKGGLISVEYMGVGLKENSYFNKQGRHFVDIEGGNFLKGLIPGLKKIARGFLSARVEFKQEEVKRVVGFGSYHSLPVVLAAWTLGIPFDVVELNTYPGKINRLFSRWAETTFIHFHPSRKWLKGKSVPIQYSLKGSVDGITKAESLKSFGLERGKRVVLIFGGSQGAEAISESWMLASLKLKEEVQVIHITQETEKSVAFYRTQKIRAYVTPFIERMDLAFIAADLAICRAGAGALREMLIYECPAILIPYPRSLDGHQDLNATFMQDKIGGAIFLKETPGLTGDLEKVVGKLFSKDDKKLSHMRSCLSQHRGSDTRENLANYIRRSCD